jgi:hypothetical protein
MDQIPDGNYNAKPTVCGFTGENETKYGFAIEFAIEVPGHETPVLRTKLCNMNSEDSAGYTLRDATTCGVDVTTPSETWMVNPERTVRVVLKSNTVNGKVYQNISVYPKDAATPGYLVNKLALPENAKKPTHANIDARVKMLLAAQNGGGHASSAGNKQPEGFTGKTSTPF